MQISLNPDYSLKWDVKRVILFSNSNTINGGIKDWCSFLHPLHTIILGTFAIEHDINKAISIIQNYTNLKKEVIQKFISHLLDNNDFTHISASLGTINFPPYILLKKAIIHPQENISSIIKQCLSINDINLSEQRLYHSPLKITWMLNNKCPVHCIYCYADTKYRSKELPFERFKEIIHECNTNNISECEIIGGDFFVKKDWNKYLQVMIDNKLPPPYLSTKNILNKDDIEILVQLNYTGVLQFSIDSLFENELREIIHSPLGYVNSIKNMFQLLSEYPMLPFSIRVSTVLIQKNTNKKTLNELFLFLSQLHIINEWEVRFAMPSFSKSNYFLCDEEQINWATTYIKDLMKKSPFFLNFIEHGILQNKQKCELSKEKKYTYRCTANMKHCFILPDGKVTICERLYWNPLFIIGDLNNNSLSEVWNSDKAHNLYFKTINEINSSSFCKKCQGREECFTKKKRCWVDIVNKWGNNITYPDPICINSLKQK